MHFVRALLVVTISFATGAQTDTSKVDMPATQDSITGNIETISDGIQTVVSIRRAELQSKGEDRTVVLHFQYGTIIAIFDGHCGGQLSDFSAKALPRLLTERLRDDIDVMTVMKDTIEEFDCSLLLPVESMFETGEDWSDPAWLDTAKEVYPRIGYGSKDERYLTGVRATFAGGARTVKGRPSFSVNAITATIWMKWKGCVEGTPNEADIIQDDALLGTLRVTRALGDHQLKAPFFMATRVLPHFEPQRLDAQEILDWGIWTPPYMLSTPVLRCHKVLPEDIFIFASDGLQDVPEDQRFDVFFSLATGDYNIALSHECIPIEDGDNAQRVIENILLGTDSKKRARELDKRTFRDDISLVVLTLK
ncbi:hypothetical protein C8R43DRAFT_1131359 [Mycena crocata]|nr:hypothetical protein C8R43DRAFT_1131359 [Mycena crocata]